MPHHDTDNDGWQQIVPSLVMPSSAAGAAGSTNDVASLSSSLSIIGQPGVYANQTLAWVSFALYTISLLWALRKCYDRCRTDAAQRRWRSAIVSSSALLTPSGSMPSLVRYAQAAEENALTKTYAHYSSAASSYHSASSSPGMTTASGGAYTASNGRGGSGTAATNSANLVGVWPATETVHDPATLWMISIFPTFLALSFACRLVWVALVGFHEHASSSTTSISGASVPTTAAVETLSFEQSLVNRIALLFYFTAYSFIVAYWADTMESTPAAERPWYFRPHRIFVITNISLYIIASGLMLARWFLASPAHDVIGFTPLGQVEVEGFGYTIEVIAIAIVFLCHSIAFLVYGTRIRRVLLLSCDTSSPAGAAAAAMAASSAINGGIRGPVIAPLTPPSPHSPPLPSSRGGNGAVNGAMTRLHGSGSTNNLLSRIPSTGDALHLADDTAAPLLSPPSSPGSDLGDQPGSRHYAGSTRGNSRRSHSPGESPTSALARTYATTASSTSASMLYGGHASMLDELSPPSSPTGVAATNTNQYGPPRRSSSLASLSRVQQQYPSSSTNGHRLLSSTYGSYDQSITRHTQPGHHPQYPWRTPTSSSGGNGGSSSATASSNNLAALVNKTGNGGNGNGGLWKSTSSQSVTNSPLLGWSHTASGSNAYTTYGSGSYHDGTSTPLLGDASMDPLAADIDDGLASRRAMSRKVVLATGVCSFLFAVRCIAFAYYPLLGSFPSLAIDRWIYPYLYYEIPEIVPGLLLLWLTTPSPTSHQAPSTTRLSAHDML